MALYNDSRYQREKKELDQLQNDQNVLFDKISELEKAQRTDTDKLETLYEREKQRIKNKYDREILTLRSRLDGIRRQIPDKTRALQMTQSEMQKEQQKTANGAPGSQRGTGTTGFKF